MNYSDIIEAIRDKRVRIADHADEEAQADRLTLDEVYFSVFNGEIIEDYPNDRPYPSCLIYVGPSAAILCTVCGHITK
jgi:hypothetical protein